LPRTEEQRIELAAAGGFVIPEKAVDGPSLVALADLVVSAGGTMNREAVALGTPVLTTFEGRVGAVDEQLIADRRMGRLDDPASVLLTRRTAEQDAAADAARVRRDPELLVDLLLSACSPFAS
jgi:predicted glycosyltransferase